MAGPTVALRALHENRSDTDPPRLEVGEAAHRLMEVEVADERSTGIPQSKRSEELVDSRDSFPKRTRETPDGIIEWLVPEPRLGSYFMALLAPGRLAANAPMMVIQEACATGKNCRDEWAIPA